MIKAKESNQVKKARQKLKKQINEEHKKINPQSIQKMSESIKNWISRHASERVNLKDKSFSVFDENQHSAKVKSHFIRKLNNQLREEKPNDLGGRVTPL